MQDVAAKVLSFAQQRPRAVCILSGSGTVSAVTLRLPASSGETITFEVEAFLKSFYVLLLVLKNYFFYKGISSVAFFLNSVGLDYKFTWS